MLEAPPLARTLASKSPAVQRGIPFQRHDIFVVIFRQRYPICDRADDTTVAGPCGKARLRFFDMTQRCKYMSITTQILIGRQVANTPLTAAPSFRTGDAARLVGRLPLSASRSAMPVLSAAIAYTLQQAHASKLRLRLLWSCRTRRARADKMRGRNLCVFVPTY